MSSYVKPFKRKITVKGQEWSYRVKEKELVVLSPNGKNLFKRELDFSKSGIKDYCEFGCCETSNNNRDEITPSRVRKFIEKACL